eukprot:Opistho-1_new@83623
MPPSLRYRRSRDQELEQPRRPDLRPVRGADDGASARREAWSTGVRQRVEPRLFSRWREPAARAGCGPRDGRPVQPAGYGRGRVSAIDTLYGVGKGRPARSQANLFSGEVSQCVGECVERTAMNMLAHAGNYDHWILAYSGGKDSSATVTVIVTLIQLGAIPAPKTLTVMYADTRMELPPLQAAARVMMDRLRDMGISVMEVVAPMY